MTVQDLLDALMGLPADALDMEVEVDHFCREPHPQDSAGVSLLGVVFHEGDHLRHNRRYVEIEVR